MLFASTTSVIGSFYCHSIWNPLDALAIKIDNIQWTDAPTIVVAILPIVHAILPPSCTGVPSPPLSGDVAIS